MDPVNDIPNPTDLTRPSLIALVWRLISTIKQLWSEVAKLRAENEELKRKNARQAAPFSKNKRKKNPKRPGRKPGQGVFRNRTAPSEAQYSGPIEDVPVKETTCPECGGDLTGDEQETVSNTEIPP
jgi:transposase